MTQPRNRSRKNKSVQKNTRAQRGGDGYGYSESLVRPVNGLAPVMAHTPYSSCAGAQRGGCGCGMLQSGGGTDGYYSDAADNMLGKVPVYGVNPCVQRGGATSYSAGYGFYPNYSAAAGVPFMATVPYGNSCMGGSRNGSRNAVRKTVRKAVRKTVRNAVRKTVRNAVRNAVRKTVRKESRKQKNTRARK